VTQRVTTPPGLESPGYTLLRRTGDYQVRRYAPFLVASAPLDGCEGPGDGSGDTGDAEASSSTAAAGGGSSSGGISPASQGRKAFGELARYLFGGNAEGRKMKMTTPVLSRTDGTMQFVIGAADAKVGGLACSGCVLFGWYGSC